MQYSFLEPASNFPLCQVSLFASHLPLIMKLVWSGSCCFCRESEVGCRKYCWKCSLKFFLRANNIFFSSIILSLVSEKERSHQLSQPNKTLLGTTLKLPYYLTTSEQQGSTCPESVCKHFVPWWWNCLDPLLAAFVENRKSAEENTAERTYRIFVNSNQTFLLLNRVGMSCRTK